MLFWAVIRAVWCCSGLSGAGLALFCAVWCRSGLSGAVLGCLGLFWAVKSCLKLSGASNLQTKQATLMKLCCVLKEHVFLRKKNRAHFTINPATPFLLQNSTATFQEHVFLRKKNPTRFTINPATPFFTTQFSRYVSRTRVFT